MQVQTQGHLGWTHCRHWCFRDSGAGRHRSCCPGARTLSLETKIDLFVTELLRSQQLGALVMVCTERAVEGQLF